MYDYLNIINIVGNMTQEEKARAYDEALEKARKYHAAAKSINDPSAARYENIFPELRESEDEKIRKELIDMINECTNWVHKKEYVKYLEKQKEQKPNYCHYGGDPNVERCKYCSAACSARLTEEQKPAWSEEDEKFFTTALWHISYCVSNGKSTDCHCDTTDWLKSIKERIKSLHPSWKPSEEQMEELKEASTIMACYDDHIAFPSLKSLYEQLEKL